MSGTTRLAAGAARRLLACAALSVTLATTGCGAEGGEAGREGLASETSAEAPAAAQVAEQGGVTPSVPAWLPDDLPAGVTSDLVARGSDVFLGEGLCHVCHGPDGTGAMGIGANLTDEEWWHNDGSYDAIVAQIMSGVAAEEVRNELGAMMPPRGGSQIGDDQVRAVAAYVWSLRFREPGQAGGA